MRIVGNFYKYILRLQKTKEFTAFANKDNEKGATAPLFIFSKSVKKDKILGIKTEYKRRSSAVFYP